MSVCYHCYSVQSQELAGGVHDPASPEEHSTPEQCISKLSALIRCTCIDTYMYMYISCVIFSRVFTTVLKALGVYFSPSRSVQPADVKNVSTILIIYSVTAPHYILYMCIGCHSYNELCVACKRCCVC